MTEENKKFPFFIVMQDSLLLLWFTKADAAFGALAVVLLSVVIVMLGIVLQRQSHNKSNSIVQPDSNTPATSPQYTCTMPTTYHSLPYAKLWIVLGDAFIAEPGWLDTLRSTTKLKTGTSVTLLNVARANSSLADQLRSVSESTLYQTAVASSDSVLAFVSYGVGVLEAGGAVASLSDELDLLLFAANMSFSAIVLIDRPDPIFGGVRVPPTYATCPLLNFPTLQTLAEHATLYTTMHLLYKSLAKRRSCAHIETDLALGQYAWPSVQSKDACAFADCQVYNVLGQALLADLVWKCIASTNEHLSARSVV